MILKNFRSQIFLIAMTTMFIIGLAAIFSGCIRQSDSGTWMSGRTVRLNVSNVETVAEVRYSIDNIHYIIEPTNPNNDLIVARVLLWNDRSSLLSLLIDEDAAALEDRQYNGFPPIDPYQQRRIVESGSSDENIYLPFIWGKMEMPQSYELDGWMVFEVPKQIQLTRFLWNQPETIRVPIEFD